MCALFVQEQAEQLYPSLGFHTSIALLFSTSMTMPHPKSPDEFWHYVVFGSCLQVLRDFGSVLI